MTMVNSGLKGLNKFTADFSKILSVSDKGRTLGIKSIQPINFENFEPIASFTFVNKIQNVVSSKYNDILYITFIGNLLNLFFFYCRLLNVNIIQEMDLKYVSDNYLLVMLFIFEC